MSVTEAQIGRELKASDKTLDEYKALKKKLISNHDRGIGVKLLSKYDVGPYLESQDKLMRVLVGYEDKCRQWVDMSKKVEAEPEDEQLLQRLRDLEAQIKTMADSELKDVNARVMNNLEGFNMTLGKLIGGLKNLKPKKGSWSKQEQDDVDALVGFLDQAHTTVKTAAAGNYDFVQEARERAVKGT